MFNGTKEDINNFRRNFQENLMAFHKKAQVCKAKLQSWLEPSKVVHVMYGANNIQSTDLIVNGLTVVEKEKNWKISIVIQLEAAFQTDIERKIFYSNYIRQDKE